jgi:hypothetical protein
MIIIKKLNPETMYTPNQNNYPRNTTLPTTVPFSQIDNKTPTAQDNRAPLPEMGLAMYKILPPSLLGALYFEMT